MRVLRYVALALLVSLASPSLSRPNCFVFNPASPDLHVVQNGNGSYTVTGLGGFIYTTYASSPDAAVAAAAPVYVDYMQKFICR